MNANKPYLLRIHTLTRHYHDRDEILLHAVFQILTDFIERECSPGVIDWEHDAEHNKARKELQSLYVWWTKKRPARKDVSGFIKGIKEPPTDEMFGQAKKIGYLDVSEWCPPDTRKKYAAYFRALDRFNKAEEKWEAEDQAMLRRLVEIRKFLWT